MLCQPDIMLFGLLPSGTMVPMGAEALPGEDIRDPLEKEEAWSR